MKLSMSVDRRPVEIGETCGRLQARICVSDDSGFGRDVNLLADERDDFALDDIVAMLRIFSNHLTSPKAA